MIRATLACAGILLGLAQKATETPKVQGYLIVSSDPAFVKRTRDTPLTPGSYNDFAKRFTTPRTRVQPWGEDYAIIFDIESGLFAFYHDQAVLLDAMVAKIGDDRLLHVGDLDSQQVAALSNALGGTSYDPKTGAPLVPTAVGVGFTKSIMVTRGSETRITESVDHESRQRLLKSLAAEKRDAAAQMRRNGTKPAPLPERVLPNDVMLTTVGRTHKRVESMEHTAPLIRELVKEIEKENQKRFARLMEKLSQGGSPSMAEELTRDKIGKEQWDAYGNEYVKNWRGRFGSESEARAFFNASDSIRIYTNLKLENMFDPGDPATSRPGSGMSATLVSVPGTYSP